MVCQCLPATPSGSQIIKVKTPRNKDRRVKCNFNLRQHLYTLTVLLPVPYYYLSRVQNAGIGRIRTFRPLLYLWRRTSRRIHIASLLYLVPGRLETDVPGNQSTEPMPVLCKTVALFRDLC